MSNTPNALLRRHIREARRRVDKDRPLLLVVEDGAHTRLLMQYALRNICRTDGAADADEALRMAEATAYDGFLIDITLPRRTGIDVLEDLRARPRYRSAPMMVVTAHALPGDRERFLDAGFDAYLSKPFRQDDLRALVRRVVGAPDARESNRTTMP